MEELEEKLISCLGTITENMEKQLCRIYKLTAELGHGQMTGAVGGRSCDLFQYLLGKREAYPDKEIMHINVEKRLAQHVYLPPMEEIIEMSSSWYGLDHEDDLDEASEGFIYPTESKGRVINEHLQWIAFSIYEMAAHYLKKEGWSMVIRDGKTIIDVLNIDKFYEK